jgi:hypothetical protein
MAPFPCGRRLRPFPLSPGPSVWCRKPRRWLPCRADILVDTRTIWT